MIAQVTEILAAAMQQGPVMLGSSRDAVPGPGSAPARQGAAGLHQAEEATREAAEQHTEEGASPAALSDAALVASSLLSLLPKSEV